MSAEIPQNILDSTYIWLLTQDQAKRALWYLPSNEQDAIEYVTNQVNIILDEKFKEESEILWESFTKLIMLYWWKIVQTPALIFYISIYGDHSLHLN